MEITFFILTLAALVTGLSKFSVGGMGMLILPILMVAFPGPDVLGVLIPLYLWNDLAVMLFYRGRIQWRLILTMLPLLLAGLLLGSWWLKGVDAEQFQLVIGIVILGMILLSLWLEHSQAAFMRHPLAHQGAGLLAGVVSMATNSAGPLLSLYLMEQRLDKQAYLSTRAWLFVIVNLCKVPLAVGLGLLTWESTLISLQGIPGLVLGALLGTWLMGRLRFDQFRWLIRAVAMVAAARLFLF